MAKRTIMAALTAVLIMIQSEGGFAVSAYEHTVKNINGKETQLGDYNGKVSLIVNTASECGFTPQYAGLQELYQKYKDRGFTVLAFPSNDFGGQEPGTEQDIAKFCDLRFKVKFPLFSKLTVKGPNKAPLYQHLIEASPTDKGAEVSWNFEKFLVNSKGEVVGRFKSKVEPTSKQITEAIEKELPKT